MLNRRLSRFAWFVLAFNLFVIVWGGFVRASKSGAGCGDHWPTCRGEVIPRSPTIETLIEFTHRATSGLLLIAVFVGFFWTLRALPKGAPGRGAAWGVLIFTLTEAAVGAGLVLLQYVASDARLGRGVWMSLHLVNTFALVAANVLWAHALSGGERMRVRQQGPLTFSFIACVLAVLLVGTSGGIAALGDTLFPVDSLSEGFAQDFSPTAHLFLRMRTFHPVIAVGTAILLAFFASTARANRPGPEVNRWSAAVGILVGVQLIAGMINVALLAPVWMQMVHLLLADAVWIAFILTAASAMSTSRRGGMPVRAIELTTG